MNLMLMEYGIGIWGLSRLTAAMPNEVARTALLRGVPLGSAPLDRRRCGRPLCCDPHVSFARSGPPMGIKPDPLNV
jgi:hypothetical protein